jgi:hypothetical protein
MAAVARAGGRHDGRLAKLSRAGMKNEREDRQNRKNRPGYQDFAVATRPDAANRFVWTMQSVQQKRLMA